ncbi:MAG: hypothetical protein WC527_07090 [Candidatus Margulisiibacteriota bacterium]
MAAIDRVLIPILRNRRPSIGFARLYGPSRPGILPIRTTFDGRSVRLFQEATAREGHAVRFPTFKTEGIIDFANVPFSTHKNTLYRHLLGTGTFQSLIDIGTIDIKKGTISMVGLEEALEEQRVSLEAGGLKLRKGEPYTFENVRRAMYRMGAENYLYSSFGDIHQDIVDALKHLHEIAMRETCMIAPVRRAVKALLASYIETIIPPEDEI